ncbi:MAG: acetate--CoA ligase family protein [bacterium]
MPDAFFLTEPACYRLLAAEGLPIPPHFLAHSPEEAAEKAALLGFPVVLKIVSPQVVHKSEAGGVRLALADAEAVRQAYRAVESSVHAFRPEAVIEGMLLLPQFQGGTELIVGGLRDVQFGPTVMFGLGGIFVELLKDVSFRVAPIDVAEAAEMIREIKGYPLLNGFRGRLPLDLETLAAFLADLSRLMERHPEIEELDLNPVFLFPKGLAIADARIKAAA